MKNKDEVLLLERLGGEHEMSKWLDIFHPDFHVVHVSNDERILLMVQAAAYFIENTNEGCLFQGSTYYSLDWSLLMGLY